MIKLGLYAVPFGYGPASKAVAIARAVDEILDVEWYVIGSGVSLEFMERENLSAHVIPLPSIDVDETVAKDIISILDGILILMHRSWANRLATELPVFFADSLSFMWQKDSFTMFPNMGRMQRFYVQDLFGAFSNMKATSLKNILAVSPIIATRGADDVTTGSLGRHVVHFGGLMNPMQPDAPRIYLEGVSGLIRRFELRNPLILTSEHAKGSYSDTLAGLDVRSLPHEQSIRALKGAEFVLTSPGLTTLLEVAHLGIPMAPLPPENYSQLLNVNNMFEHFGPKLHEIWRFLAIEYREIPLRLPERVGVERVYELNRKKLSDTAFQSAFLELGNDASRRKTTLPAELKFTENGADAIATDIKRYFAKLQH